MAHTYLVKAQKKTYKRYRRLKMSTKMFCIPVLLCGAVLALAPAGYAKNYHMTASETVPGATAELRVDKEKNGDVQVELKADHLAKPGRLTPSASVYVVWFQKENSPPQIQGTLRVGNDLKAELTSTTTFHNFTVLVTAETDSQPKFPSEQVVLRATVQQ
jgi:hypothetical protein